MDNFWLSPSIKERIEKTLTWGIFVFFRLSGDAPDAWNVFTDKELTHYRRVTGLELVLLQTYGNLMFSGD